MPFPRVTINVRNGSHCKFPNASSSWRLPPKFSACEIGERTRANGVKTKFAKLASPHSPGVASMCAIERERARAETRKTPPQLEKEKDARDDEIYTARRGRSRRPRA